MTVPETMSLKRLKKEWDALGELDPFWAILADRSKRHGGWQPQDFFATGTREVEELMDSAASLGLPARRQTALDFGCGVGRLTRALAGQFKRCYGVDISQSMISAAKALDPPPNCRFIVNAGERLEMFQDGFFDLIYSTLVLQHVPHRRAIESYVSEFVRTLRDGGLLVFQLPTHIPLWKRAQPRRRAYTLLRTLGVTDRVLYRRLGLAPIRMNFIPRSRVVELLDHVGGTLLDVRPDTRAGSSISSATFYVTKGSRPASKSG